MIDIFRGYNSLIRPVKSDNGTAVNEPTLVRFGLQLVLLINVVSRSIPTFGTEDASYIPYVVSQDERNQIMHTNVWMTLVSENSA